MNLAQACKPYNKALYKSSLSQRTIMEYSNICRTIEFYYGCYALDSKSADSFVRLSVNIRDTCGKIGITVLRNIIKYAGYPEIAARVIHPKLHTIKREIPAWTEAEIEFFLKNANKLSARIAECAYLTAQRVSDLVEIDLSHPAHTNEYMCVLQKKTSNLAYIPITYRLANLIKTAKNNLLVYDPFGGKLKPEAASYLIKREVKKLGMRKELSIHGLRKSRAEFLAANGFSVYQIAAVTGHADPQNLNIYTRLYSRRNAAKIMKTQLRRRETWKKNVDRKNKAC